MTKLNKVKFLKIILAIVVAALFIGIIIFLFPVMRDLSSKQGQIAFKEKVADTGILGLLSLFGLQIAQIFLIVIPGEPIEILAGMCYGAIGGTIFITISACFISTLVFLMVRKYGRKFVYNFFDEKHISKIENNKLFQNPKKIEYILLILFLLPGTPKDLIVYVSGLLPIKPINFILISTFARLPSIISSTLAGANIVTGNWKLGVILYTIIVLIIGIIIFIINKLDKSKITEDAIKGISKK